MERLSTFLLTFLEIQTTETCLNEKTWHYLGWLWNANYKLLLDYISPVYIGLLYVVAKFRHSVMKSDYFENFNFKNCHLSIVPDNPDRRKQRSIKYIIW